MDLETDDLDDLWLWLGVAVAFWTAVVVVTYLRRRQSARVAADAQRPRETRMKSRG